MRVAYLINRYPAASHSFIRREIEAVEAEGTEVYRFSVRPAQLAELPDERDRAEVAKTVVLLQLGVFRLLFDVLRAMFLSPARFLAATQTALSGVEWRPGPVVRRAAYLAEAAALARRLRAQRVDHLHAHFGTNPAMVARIAGKLSGIPFSFTVHGPDEFDAPAALDLRGKIADSAFCVGISSYGRSQLMRWSAFADWTKIEVVRCGVDESYLAERDHSHLPDVPHLCAVARLSGQKGIPLLIEAAARLVNVGKSFRLTLVGDGEMRPEIEAMIHRLDLQDVVTITGWASSEKVIDHLLGSRAMVLPSFAEGLPVVIMEALALERPVIVTAIAGTPELVDEQCGWLMPAGSIDALVDALGAVIDAPVERLAAMGRVGRERVLARHDSRTNGRQLNALFHRYRRGPG
ncbi:MAG: colanic acid biosynthesis glycosyltransferase WcaL [Sphingopyxis sp.]|nr:colanic acid biosynthesis glycosyltransferase WcaL [Sphingopyxis sp.]